MCLWGPRRSSWCVLLLLVAGWPALAQESPAQLRVDMYRGGFATVNSFVFSNGKSQIVMDVQRKSYEADKLIALIKAKGLPLSHVLITHGHTDHFTGMARLHQAFPQARIVVATEEIKRAIKAYAIYMGSGGETGAEPALEPALKPKTPQNPGGFDYENWIEVLPSKTLSLDGGGTLELSTDYLPAEADYMTTVYSPELNALFLSDFGYNRVHLWLGDDISRQDIANWKAELGRIKRDYAARNPTVYPGHGAVTDMSMFDTVIGYIDDYTRVTLAAKTRREAMAQMTALYPGWGEADFFLKYSLENHVKE